jgi:uncharacterized repeat protein (TIGR03803 family)
LRNALRFAQTSLSLSIAALFAFCSVSVAASKDRVLHAFSSQVRGASPVAMVSDSQGNLYGTTQFGGDYNLGAVYEFSPSAGGGWTETVLHSFAAGNDGSWPMALTIDSQGNLYGLTEYGPAGCSNGGCSTVFELSRNASGTWVKSIIYTFPASNPYPNLGLLAISGGNLYGSTSYGSSSGNSSSVYELTPSAGTWTQTTLYTFSAGSVANYSISGLAFDSAGNIYGAIGGTATAPQGLVFELSPSGSSWTESTLYTFTGGASGGIPTGILIYQNGNLYGATQQGGEGKCGNTVGCGVVFQLTPGVTGWSESVLYGFSGFEFGTPLNPSISGFDGSGNLYGFTEFGGHGKCSTCGAVFQFSPNGSGSWSETDLWNFMAKRDGLYPVAIVLGGSGQLYGINLGPADVFPTQGQIFGLSSTGGSGEWTFSALYTFPTTDGQWPSPGLVADRAGNFYGTTGYGGKNNVGSVFELGPVGSGWKETELYSFGPQPTTLYYSVGPSVLTPDGKGNFYGTTQFGGLYGDGSVFEMSPKAGGGWQETDIYSFEGVQFEPTGGVVFDSAGNIYGVTYRGGANRVGVVFKLTQNAGVWQGGVISAFKGYPADGANPLAGLTVDAQGNLFGTTEYGGSGDCTSKHEVVGCGTVFELSYSAGSGWTETMLHSFAGNSSGDGALPFASLILDSSGNLYGTTFAGGLSGPRCGFYGNGGCGTVFELSPSDGKWNETLLYEFSGQKADGSSPDGPLLQDGSGNFYGVASGGGEYDFGAIFKLSPATGGGWTEGLVYDFGATANDGKYPYGSLIFGLSGNIYGVTPDGGISGGVDDDGQGTIFEVKP